MLGFIRLFTCRVLVLWFDCMVCLLADFRFLVCL